MKIRRGWTAFLFLSLAGAVSAAMPDAAQLARDIESGRVDPGHYDFAAAGYWQLDETQRRMWFSNFVVALKLINPKSWAGCSPEALRREAAMVWTGFLQMAPDAAAWSAAVEPLRKRLQEFDAYVASVAPASGAASGPQARPRQDPRVVELLAREAREQAMRGALTEARWTADLPALAASWWMGAYSLRYGTMDCPNTEWLRKQLAEIGWFEIPRFGAEADNAAWLLTQHADRTPEFQREVLTRLQALPPEKTSQKNLAYLWDRVARADGRPQRYGTQGGCHADGSWEPHEVEDPAHLDERRTALGLLPIAEHTQQIRKACPQPAR